MLPDSDQSFDNITLLPPTLPPIEREEGRIYSFADVQERLVQAVLTLGRLGDREKGWMTVKAMWPDIVREDGRGDYDARGVDGVAPVLRPLPATRRDIAEMEEALGWVMAAPERDRRLIGLAIGALARGEKRVPWAKLMRPMGLTLGQHGLRKRYERAMRAVVAAANRLISRP